MHRRGIRLVCEQLEDRSVPSNFTAANTDQLIAAINASNQSPGPDTILLAPNTTFNLTAVNNRTNGANGFPVIAAANNLSIVGQGGDIIQRDRSVGLSYRLLAVASGGTLTLSQVTLQYGEAGTSSTDPGAGGAIYNQGTLVLSGVTVQYNLAASSTGTNTIVAGGGIWSSGTLTLKNGTLIRANRASGGGSQSVAGGDASGGGIWSSGTLTVEPGTRFEGNGAVGGYGMVNTSGRGGVGRGGGLYIAGGTATLTGATLINNRAGGGEGALTGKLVCGDYGCYYVYSYTGDGGDGYGGGLYVAKGTVTLSGDTVQSNTAGGGVGKKDGTGYGGGVFLAGPAKVSLDAFTLVNTVKNTDSSGTDGITANIDGPYTLIT